VCRDIASRAQTLFCIGKIDRNRDNTPAPFLSAAPVRLIGKKVSQAAER
jgi:hypothetical protein